MIAVCWRLMAGHEVDAVVSAGLRAKSLVAAAQMRTCQAEFDAGRLLAQEAVTLLRSLGERTLRDELRVVIHDETTTAYFTFSSQMRPQVFEFRVFGLKNGILLDDKHHVLIKLKGTKYSYTVSADHADVTCPWGNHIRLHRPSPKWPRMELGMPYVEFPVPTGTAASPVRAK